MDHALAVIHQANPRCLPISLEIGHHAEAVSLLVTFPPSLRSLVEGQLTAQYPDGRLQPVPVEQVPPGQRIWDADLSLWPDIFPIRRYGQMEDTINRQTADPLAGLLSTLIRSRRDGLKSRIEITVRPARASAQHRAGHCIRSLATPFFRHYPKFARLYIALATSPSRTKRLLGWMLARVVHRSSGQTPTVPLTTTASRSHDREEDLQAAADKLGKNLFETRIRLIVTGPSEAEEAAREKLQEMAGSFGLFSLPRLAAFSMGQVRTHVTLPRQGRASPFLLSTEELATLWHPSTVTVRAPTMAQVESREFEPPLTLPRASDHPELAVLGITAFRSQRDRFGILPDDRLRHTAILGKTGMGKSTLLYNLLISDIAAGRGVALIDPHGDLAESLLPAIPAARTNDVVLFDAGDRIHPLAFNPLSCSDAMRRPLVASGVLSAFKKLYADSWGPRLEHILRNALLALLEMPGSSLVSVLRLLTDVRYRKSVLAHVTDPIVRDFWEREFAAMPPKFQIEAIAPIQNKIGAFASSPLLRNIIGQAENRLDLRQTMDQGKVLIVNLSKGRIGDDASMLLGSLLVTSLQIAAMSRADVPEHERREFHVYVDEFQNFATDSFATILSEARKYRLSLTLANQYLAQMDDNTAAAVFGNVGTLVMFQVGAKDAEILSEQMAGGLTPEDLMTLPRHQAYARLLINGQPSRPFSMRTLPPTTRRLDERRAEIIRRYSRQRYNRPASKVERDLASV